MQAGLKEATKLLGNESARKLVVDNPQLVIENRDWSYV